MAGLAASAVARGSWLKAAASSGLRLSVLTDEISQDFGHACEVASRDFGMGFVDLREIDGQNLMKWDAARIAEVRKTLDRFKLRVACLATPIFKVDWPDAPKSSFSPKRDQFGAEAKQNVVLVLENEYACNTATGAEAGRLLAAIPDEALEITWDPGNAQFRDETPFPGGYAAIPKGRIGHMHCKDAVRKAGGGWEWAAMGRGVIDWVGQFRALKNDGYRHAVTLETHWRGAGTPEASSRESFAGMKQLLQKAGAL